MGTATNNKSIKGRLVVTEGQLSDTALEFYFNPTEYTISKSNDWTTTANKGRNVPKFEFGGGKPRQLQMELLFDAFTFESQYSAGQQGSSDLPKTLNLLFNFMMIDKDGKAKGPNSQMSKPPKCRLEWGQFTKDVGFDCYITSCSVKYTMFNENGVPIRATASITLLEARDSEDRLPTNPTSLGDPGRRLHTVVEGERLDWIAYQELGSTGEWRRIAEANRSTAFRRLRPGTVLVIPPS